MGSLTHAASAPPSTLDDPDLERAGAGEAAAFVMDVHDLASDRHVGGALFRGSGLVGLFIEPGPFAEWGDLLVRVLDGFVEGLAGAVVDFVGFGELVDKRGHGKFSLLVCGLNGRGRPRKKRPTAAVGRYRCGART